MNARTQLNKAARTLAVAVAVCISALIATTTNANAADFVIKPCTIELGPFANQWSTYAGSAWQVPNDCPAPTQLEMIAPALSNETQHTSTYALYSLAVKSVTVKLTGSNGASRGIEQGLRACNTIACGTLATVSGDAITVPETITLTQANGGLPPGTNQLQLNATCLPDPGDASAVLECPQGEGLTITELLITGTDSTPPTVDAYLSDSWTTLPSPSPWTDEPTVFGASAIDDESGIAATNVSMDAYVESSCHEMIDGFLPLPCPGDVGVFGIARPEELPDGSSTVTITATNAVGMVGTDSATVRFDTTPPDQPSIPDFHANSEGWNNSEFVTVDWDNGREKLESAVDSGIVSARYDIDPLSPGAATDPPPQEVAGPNIDSITTQVPSSGDWRFTVWTKDLVGNESPARTAVFHVDTIRPSKPTISPITPINQQNAAAGKLINWSLPASPAKSGTCGYKLAINGLAGYEPTSGPGVQLIDDDVTSYQLSAPGILSLNDGSLTLHLRATSCAGLDGPTQHVPLLIDRVLPTITAAPESGWLTQGQKVALNAADGQPADGQSGVKSISYWLDGDSANPTTVNASVAEVPIAEGSHTLTYLTEDLAGNRTLAKQLDVGVDSVLPDASFAAFDPEHPTVINAHVADAASGIADAWIDYQEPGSAVWRRLDSSPASGKSAAVKAEFRDDDAMAPGVYQLRLSAQDVAGNVTTTTQRIDGSSAALTLPLRPRPVLTAKVGGAGKQPPVANLVTVDFGARTKLGGALIGATGTPIAGAQLTVYETPEGGSRSPVATLTTDAQGRYQLLVQPNVSRTLTVRFAGGAAIGPASAEATTNTRARIKLKPTAQILRSGRTLRLRGKITPGFAGIPARGKRIEIQFKIGNRWSNFSSSARTSSDGTFATPFRYTAKRRAVKFKIRAVAITEAGWPYAEGCSKPITLVVRP